MSKKIKISYSYAKGYHPVNVLGAIGGMESSTQIVINFFNEYNSLPKGEEFFLTESGERTENIAIYDDEVDIVRHIETGVAINIDTALKLRNWLNIQLEPFEKSITSDITNNNDKKEN